MYENCQRQSCNAFLAYLSMQKLLMRNVALYINFALSEPVIGDAAVLINPLTKFDESSICIAIITMEYEITNNVPQLN